MMWSILALLLLWKQTTIVLGQAALLDVVSDGFAVGGVLHGYDPEWDDGEYLVTADREFNAITSSWYMGFNGFNPSGFVDVVDWATARGKRVHGHVLVYPYANEAYWEANPNADTLSTLRDFVDQAARVRQGQVWLWDVVNEAFGYPGWSENTVDDDGIRSDYREYQHLGPGYIDQAFYWAKDADPNAILVLCETNAEEYNDRSTNVYNWMVRKRNEGVPIDGIAFQMHAAIDGLGDTGWQKDINSVRSNFQRFAAAGFRIFITEMDVMSTAATDRTQIPSAAQQQEQAQVYREVAQLAAEMPAVESLLLWDFSDFRSWMQPSPFQLGPYPEGTYFFPCIWFGGGVGDILLEKPAYSALREGLAAPEPYWERLTSMWNPSNGVFGRHGVQQGDGSWEPGYGVGLFQYNPNWWSLQWTFEEYPPGYGSYRLICRWAGDAAYLTRVGVYNSQEQRWDPTNKVSMHGAGFNADGSPWDSQLWFVDYSTSYGGSWRIINGWDYATGFLTRDGVQVSDNPPAWEPGFTVSLHPRQDNWSSQYWDAQAA